MMRSLRPVGREQVASAPATHLVDLTGTGMPGLAQLLAQKGQVISGPADPSDLATISELQRAGIRADTAHPPRGTRLLVHGSLLGRLDPRRLSALRRGIAQESRQEILRDLTRGRRTIAAVGGPVAATSGAMLAWTLSLAGSDPTILLDQAVPQLGGWGKLGQGDTCLVQTGEPEGLGELCELRPQVAIAFPWRDAERTHQIGRLFDAIPQDGCLIGESETTWRTHLRPGVAPTLETVSLARGARWWGGDLREDRGVYRFRAFRDGLFALEVRLQVPGIPSVVAALGAVAAGYRLGLSAAAIKEGLEEFEGISRGFQSRGSYRGVTLIDDDSRDPIAVSETLKLARAVFGRRKIWATFRNDTVGSDREAAQDALIEASGVLIVADSNPGDLPETRELARSLSSIDRPALWASDLSEAVAMLDEYLEPGDVLLTLGAGNVGTIADALIGRLSADRQDD